MNDHAALRRTLAATTARAFLIAILCFWNGLAAAQETGKLVPALGWDLQNQGGFPTSIAADAQNAIWVGTEGSGVWRYDPRAEQWTQFTTNDGLGDDDIYAVAVDQQNRVWVGHLNHGVSVWNGEKWKNYGLLDGPLGDRVFAIAVCPTDGDVWIATDCGLTRYSVSKGEWDDYTRASGLPSNQIQSLAFDAEGNVLLGTQCDGIAIGSWSGKGYQWRAQSGPVEPPASGMGEGLPGQLVNAVFAPLSAPREMSQALALATPFGLGGTPDREHWFHLRRAGIASKNAPPAGNIFPLGNVVPPGMMPREDWILCFAEDSDAQEVWVGYRHRGVEARDSKTGAVTKGSESSDGAEETTLVRAILPTTLKTKNVHRAQEGVDGPVLFAVCGGNSGGLQTLESMSETPVVAGPRRSKPFPALPTPTKAPAADSFAPLRERVARSNQTFKRGEAFFLGDDWRTQGDWIGRYGGSFAMLCGTGKPSAVHEGDPGFGASVAVGNRTELHPADHYVAEESTENGSVLYSPWLGTRREAEVNDVHPPQGITPPFNGPGLRVTVDVPAGAHCVSLYFHNNDAHFGPTNQYRDYDVQVFASPKEKEKAGPVQPLARARVTDFAGGVYKMFLVQGPAQFLIRIGSNQRFVTKLQGIFIDRLTGEVPDERKKLPGFDVAEFAPAGVDSTEAMENNPVIGAAYNLWLSLDGVLDHPDLIGLQLPLRIWAYRAAVAAEAPAELLESWRWQIGIWTPEDRESFREKMAEAFKASSVGKSPE